MTEPILAALAQGDTEPLVRWIWITDHLDDIGSRAVQHVYLTVVSVVAAFLIAAPLSVLAYRRRWLVVPITWVGGILYTIPSIAFIALLLPFTGLSLTTVAVPLTTYNLLILFRNTLAGLDSVSADVKEAAAGMGYTKRQLLWRIEVPLATPVIIAGLRIATVSSVGLVTVAALIGRGGFGQFILMGLDQFFWTPLILGIVLSIALAVSADLLLLLVQRLATPWARAAGVRTTGDTTFAKGGGEMSVA
jgi:osmoprotectant transport system permease protein